MTKCFRKYNAIFSLNNFGGVFSVVSVVLFCSFCAFSQGVSQAQKDYIERYKEIALEHQKKYGIPAYITLAQGLLESDAGRSELARKANNHFGIKCGGAWKGKTVKHKAEKGKECFRRYDRVEDSFEDHAQFLKRERYAPLYKIKISNYKKWAKTLRKCGYATDRKYPDKLISLIERYNLHKIK